MASGPKLVADRTEHGTEARRVHQALESLQPSLTLAHGLVRVLDSVVLAPAAEMGDARHGGGFRRGVAPGRLRWRTVPFVVPSRACEGSASRRVRSAGSRRG